MAMAAFFAKPLHADAWRGRSAAAWSGNHQPVGAICPYCDEDGYTESFEELPAGVLMTAECAVCGVRAEHFVTGWRTPRS